MNAALGPTTLTRHHMRGWFTSLLFSALGLGGPAILLAFDSILQLACQGPAIVEGFVHQTTATRSVSILEALLLCSARRIPTSVNLCLGVGEAVSLLAMSTLGDHVHQGIGLHLASPESTQTVLIRERF